MNNEKQIKMTFKLISLQKDIFKLNFKEAWDMLEEIGQPKVEEIISPKGDEELVIIFNLIINIEELLTSRIANAIDEIGDNCDIVITSVVEIEE